MADEVDQVLDDAIRNTETEILNEAFTDAPAEETPPAVEVAEVPATEKPRNELGQFAAKEQPKSEPVVEAKAPEVVKEDDGQAQVPSWRLKEISAERRAAEAERDALKTQLADIQRQLAAQQPKVEQPKQEDIDPLLDPQGFAKRLKDDFSQQLSEMRLNSNLQITHVRHGEKFEKAFEALLGEGQKGNRQLVNQLVGEPNPGEAIIKWYSNAETLREVGGDPAAYRERLRQELLKDPEFLKAAHEASLTQAGGQPQQRQTVQLPPSLTRATGSSSNVDPSDTDDSERGIFEHAFK